MKIAFATNNKKTLCEKIGFCKYIWIYDTTTKTEKLIDNPIYNKALDSGYKDCGDHGLGTGKVLPPLLAEEDVEIFYAKKFGEGLLDNLELYKIKPVVTKSSIEEILKEY